MVRKILIDVAKPSCGFTYVASQGREDGISQIWNFLLIWAILQNWGVFFLFGQFLRREYVGERKQTKINLKSCVVPGVAWWDLAEDMDKHKHRHVDKDLLLNR